MVIDFHAHMFPEKVSAKALEKLSKLSLAKYFTNGTAKDLSASMTEAGVDYSVNLPVVTDSRQVEKINSSMLEAKASLLEQGIIAFGGIHPEYENYKAELRRLKQGGILGIKIHPAYQRADIDDIRMMRIIDYASQLGLITLTHAGIDIGVNDHNYASVSQLIKVIDQVKPEKLVLAHMGNWACWNEVENELAGADVWFDTAFTIGSVETGEYEGENPYISCSLSDEDFMRIARKHGMDRILFGTDSPWKSQKEYLGRIWNMPLTAQEKQMLLGQNALELLGNFG